MDFFAMPSLMLRLRVHPCSTSAKYHSVRLSAIGAALAPARKRERLVVLKRRVEHRAVYLKPWHYECPLAVLSSSSSDALRDNRGKLLLLLKRHLATSEAKCMEGLV